MPDPLLVLDPHSGLVRQPFMSAPGPGRLLWSVGAVPLTLEQEHQAESVTPCLRIDTAGACGTDRDETIVRAAGEVVERWAVSAQRLRGDALLFPDAGPSGAAAGPSADFCLRRGLCELIERDAVMRGWYLGQGAHVLPPAQADAALTGTEAATRRLREVLHRLLGRGVELRLIALPSRCAELTAVMCVLVDTREQVVACGLGCAANPGRGVRTAFREACQILDLYAALREVGGRPSRPTAVRSDADRAIWWGAKGNLAALQEWLAGLPVGRQDSEPAVFSWKELLSSSSFTELTDTLPAVVRDVGWHAGRVENCVLVPLVMDETGAVGRRLTRASRHGIPHPVL